MGPSAAGFVLGIVKAYTTRVGSGPFPTELDDEIGQRLGERGHEFGTVTGRKRRCGWFDAVLVRQAVAVSGVTGIALTKLDVLDGFETIKICTGYRLDGKTFDYLPPHAADQAAVEPVYEEIEGWQRDRPRGARSWADLPAQAIKYVRRIEELIAARWRWSRPARSATTRSWCATRSRASAAPRIGRRFPGCLIFDGDLFHPRVGRAAPHPLDHPRRQLPSPP